MPRHGKLGMRFMFSPTFRRFVLMALCACIVIAAGCARRKPAESPTKPRSLFVDKLSPKPNSPGKDANANVPQGPKIEFTQHGVTLRWSEKNGTQMTASAKSASFNEVTQVGTLLDFSAKLYENGKLTAAISAPRATADTAKRTILASGGVTLKSLERQTVVNAAWIKWNANTRKVVGNGGVRIKSTSGTVDGAAFVADTALKTLTVKDSAKGLDL